MGVARGGWSGAAAVRAEVLERTRFGASIPFREGRRELRAFRTFDAANQSAESLFVQSPVEEPGQSPPSADPSPSGSAAINSNRCFMVE